MARSFRTLAIAVILALTLSACATDPDEVNRSAAPIPDAPDTGGNPESSSSSQAQRSATGIFTSIDGKTTGHVVVEVEETTDDFGVTVPLATVKLFDIATPYEHLTPGGSLAPRGEDPCFDIGLRASGGMIVPDEHGSATATMPAESEGHYLHEIVLHLDWTQVDTEAESCMQPIVARAPLIWND